MASLSAAVRLGGRPKATVRKHTINHEAEKQRMPRGVSFSKTRAHTHAHLPCAAKATEHVDGQLFSVRVRQLTQNLVLVNAFNGTCPQCKSQGGAAAGMAVY